MSKIITLCEVKWNSKNKCYVITTHHKEGAWEGASSGAKIYPVMGPSGKYFVMTSWGMGIPVAVYKDETEIVDSLMKQYRCKVMVISD